MQMRRVNNRFRTARPKRTKPFRIVAGLVFGSLLMLTFDESAAQVYTPQQRARYSAAKEKGWNGLAEFSALCREGMRHACVAERDVIALTRINRLLAARQFDAAIPEMRALCQQGRQPVCDGLLRVEEASRRAKVPAAPRAALPMPKTPVVALPPVRTTQSTTPPGLAGPVVPGTSVARPMPLPNNREMRTEFTSDVSDCLSMSDKPGYGAFVNRCEYAVVYTMCVLDPPEGAWSYSFRCVPGQSPRHLGTVGARNIQGDHNRGGKRTYWFGCRYTSGSNEIVSYDIDSRSVVFHVGEGLKGRCKMTTRPAG